MATGGVPQTIAALKAGAVDAIALSMFTMANLKFAGQVRELVAVADYLPKEWMDTTIFGTRDFIVKNPEVVRKFVKATLWAADFVQNNREWSIEKLKSLLGYSEEAAPEVYKLLVYSKDGKINRRALENVTRFLIEYGIVPKEKMPSVEAIYTMEFTGQ